MQDGVVVGDYIICLLAFFNIFIYLFIIIIIFISKKRGPERGLEGGPKRGPKGGSRREGPRFVYTPFAAPPMYATSRPLRIVGSNSRIVFEASTPLSPPKT